MADSDKLDALRRIVAHYTAMDEAALLEADSLYVLLKARLTKKELKILLALAQNEPVDALCDRLKLDPERFEKLKQSARDKLRREKAKATLSKDD